jgi:homoserine O-acetyltransferase
VSETARESGSIGRVETHIAKIELPSDGFKLECGKALPALDVAYETYGTLSPKKDNVVFICHALSGDAHVAGYHGDSATSKGWWNEMVGPGKGIDTDHYFVVCANILGGCKGTTGPSSVNPITDKPYGSAFPQITVGDIVNAHCLLLKHLNISRLAAIVGGSFGGMQVLEWTIRYPGMIARAICIASATRLSAQALAFDIVGREAIISDPDWQGGDYYDTGRSPTHGLAQARKIGHITYLSPEMMETKFGRERTGRKPDQALDFHTDFQVESYLDHQGNKFLERFDANSYLHITKAMDEYDLSERFGDLDKAFASIQAKVLVVALSSDWLFPAEQSVEIANGLLRANKPVSYCHLQAPHGHDAFLLDVKHLSELLRAFMPWIEKEDKEDKRQEFPKDEERRKDFRIILDMVSPGARVLDLGCGTGDLLTLLRRQRGIYGLGVDIDLQAVIDVIDKGHDTFQEDIDNGLAMIPDGTYDYAILSETLQTVMKPQFVLQEMLRVARKGIVSFPNIGKWSHRLRLWTTGRMPKGGALPFEWYDTPNIHLFTLNDFVDICRKNGITILKMVCISDCWLGRLLVSVGLRNLGADRVLVTIARRTE